MAENSPKARGSIIIEEIDVLCSGKRIEITLSIKYAKQPITKKMPIIFGMNLDLIMSIPKGNNQSPQKIPTTEIPN